MYSAFSTLDATLPPCKPPQSFLIATQHSHYYDDQTDLTSRPQVTLTPEGFNDDSEPKSL
ncbi:hypothetical Protein YC6258_01932 [Gynuella sunshinyii YC6258]|uniref:Uncharacterized protein n=1 Tax=Gynuella sunshinyii YC6258 TaxID=1445510 RepID=A0A0C5VI80_9GAMM|nr:hypothetical Protein YC6258_01932 [Gynuella sunshinyii YC6258]